MFTLFEYIPVFITIKPPIHGEHVYRLVMVRLNEMLERVSAGFSTESWLEDCVAEKQNLFDILRYKSFKIETQF